MHAYYYYFEFVLIINKFRSIVLLLIRLYILPNNMVDLRSDRFWSDLIYSWSRAFFPVWRPAQDGEHAERLQIYSQRYS
jgi:hypothetical protein